jgi:hypothetical protein
MLSSDGLHKTVRHLQCHRHSLSASNVKVLALSCIQFIFCPPRGDPSTELLRLFLLLHTRPVSLGKTDVP